MVAARAMLAITLLARSATLGLAGATRSVQSSLAVLRHLRAGAPGCRSLVGGRVGRGCRDETVGRPRPWSRLVDASGRAIVEVVPSLDWPRCSTRRGRAAVAPGARRCAGWSRRRGAAAGALSPLARRSPARRAVNVLRPDRGRRSGPPSSGAAGRRRRAGRADRPARSPTPGSTCSTPGAEPGADRRARRAVHRRRRRGARLPRPARADGRALRRPIRSAARRARACTAPATWRAGAPTASSSSSGRCDHQVKMRGFRIELGRDRGRAGAPPAASREAVGRGARGPRRRPRLVAYVVPRRRAPPSRRAADGSSRERLPDVHGARRRSSSLDALPLTPNGKVDRRALPAPEPAGAVARAYVAAPRRRSRRCVADIWAEVLGVRAASASTTTSSSSAATRCSRPASIVATRARRSASSCRCGGSSRRRPWPGWRRRIDAGAARPRPAAAAALRALGRGRASCRCRSRSSGSGSSTSSSPAAPPTTSRSRSGCAAPLDVGALERRAAPSSCDRHEVLRTTFASRRRRARPDRRRRRRAVRLAVVGPDRLTRRRARRGRRAARADRRGAAAVRPRRGARSCRARLLRLADDDHVLVLTMHHIVADGWSIARARAASSRRSTRPCPRAAARRRCRTADPVRRLRGLAARSGSTARRSSEQLALLARAARRRARAARAARPTGRGPPVPTRRGATRRVRLSPPTSPRACAALAAARGRDAVHDAAGRLPGAAAPLHRPGRHRGRHADRRTARGPRSRS